MTCNYENEHLSEEKRQARLKSGIHLALEDHKTSLLSRRSFLKNGVRIAAGVLLAKFTGVFGELTTFAQAAPKRIYIAPDDHTDYFWSADETTYQQAFLEMLDYYLNQADATANELSPYQSRWNCDGSFWMWTYEKYRSAAQFERLIERIRDGHISVPLNALCVCLGGTPAEAVLRGMYYSGHVERRYNLRFLLAYSIENQTLPYGLGALWAGAGAEYSWKGICNCATKVPNAGDRQYDIYWWVGPDGSRILMKWNSLLVGNKPGLSDPNQGMGGYAEAYKPALVVDYVDADPAFIARYPHRVIGAFGHGWDGIKVLTQEFVSVAQSKTNANRQVIVSNELDFFEDFETTYGMDLPSLSCSFGNEWELDCAALAEVFARVKRAVEKLHGAEALATLVSLQDSAFLNGRETARDQAWMDLGLFWEHDMGGGPGDLTAGRIAWQKRLAQEIESYVNTLYSDAVTALGGMIRKSGTNPRFYVFNPLSWTRTDIADFPYSGSIPAHIIDLSTNSEVASQIVVIDGTQYLRVLAANVPSIGYKVFEIHSGAGQVDFSIGAPTANGSIIENDFYRITVANRGAITSLIDKTRSNREFAQTIGGRVINDLEAGSGSLVIENAGPVSVTLLATMTTSSPLKHTSRITLGRNSNRIDIRNDITQNFDATFTWSFGFNLTSPDVWHEEVGAVIRAKLLAAGGHYSPRNARYDWLTLNHFADMSDGTVGVTLSNVDCYYMRLGNSTVTSLDTNSPQISVLVGGRDPNDGGSVIFNQGGDTHFLQRFALQTHDTYNPVLAMKFALEHQNPLVTGAITGGDAYPETSYSFLTISNPNVLLWTLKPADDGVVSEVVARLWNLTDTAQDFSLALSSWSILNAQHTTHIETPLEVATVVNGALTESLVANQLKTFSMSLNEVNQAPVLNPIGDKTVSEGSVLTFMASASDADLPPQVLTYSLVGAPAGASINATTGAFSWMPSEAQGPGVYTFTVKVTDDGVPSLSDEEEIVVTVNEVNQAPVLNPIGDKTVVEGSVLTFMASASDADLPPQVLTYSLVGAPAGASINATTGAFSWMPSEAQGPGVYTFTVKVTDDGVPPLSVEETITVAVEAASPGSPSYHIYLPIIFK